MKHLFHKIALITFFTGSLFANSCIKNASAIAHTLDSAILGEVINEETRLTKVPSSKFPKLMARNSFPITWINLNIAVNDQKQMIAEMIVPDRKTTRPAGGGLRRYDAHIAKMFELTSYECRDQRAYRNWNGIRWHYYAGNRDFDMGEFFISCKLARDIAKAYGLSSSEVTQVTYYRAEDSIDVPKLNIVGSKVPTWLKFTQNFKPVAQAQTINDSQIIRSLVTQSTRYKGVVRVKSINIVNNYALATYGYGLGGEQALLKKNRGKWRIVTSDRGSIQEASILMNYGVPRNIAFELSSGPDI